MPTDYTGAQTIKTPTYRSPVAGSTAQPSAMDAWQKLMRRSGGGGQVSAMQQPATLTRSASNMAPATVTRQQQPQFQSAMQSFAQQPQGGTAPQPSTGIARNDYYNPYGLTSAQAANQQQAAQNLQTYLNGLGISAGTQGQAGGQMTRPNNPVGFGNQGGATNATGPTQTVATPTSSPPTPPAGLTPQQIAGFQAWRQQNPNGTMQQYVNSLQAPRHTMDPQQTAAIQSWMAAHPGSTLIDYSRAMDTRSPEQQWAAYDAAIARQQQTGQQMFIYPPGVPRPQGPSQTVGSITSNQGGMAGQPVRPTNPVAFGNQGGTTNAPTLNETVPVGSPANMTIAGTGQGQFGGENGPMGGQPTRTGNPIAFGNQGGTTNAPVQPPQPPAPVQPAYNPMQDQTARGYLQEIQSMDPTMAAKLTGSYQNFGDVLAAYNKVRAHYNQQQSAQPAPITNLDDANRAMMAGPMTGSQQQGALQATLNSFNGGLSPDIAAYAAQHPENIALQNLAGSYASAIAQGNTAQAARMAYDFVNAAGGYVPSAPAGSPAPPPPQAVPIAAQSNRFEYVWDPATQTMTPRPLTPYYSAPAA